MKYDSKYRFPKFTVRLRVQIVYDPSSSRNLQADFPTGSPQFVIGELLLATLWDDTTQSNTHDHRSDYIICLEPNIAVNDQ